MQQVRINRRQFLQSMATVGGSAAIWAALDAWGLAKPVRQERPNLEGQVQNVKLLILGAGPGGLVSAYELGKLGYEIQILEARDRPGGHIWTVRRGTELTEYGGERQVCEFDEGLYYNPGPWRIPYHHEANLHYCKELQVAVEPFINYQEANYYYVEGDFGPLSGRPIRARAFKTDMAGYTSELLAKFARNQALDTGLSQEHIEQLVDYLVYEGLLEADTLRYTGSSHRGFINAPGAGMTPGVPESPLPFADLLPYAAELLRAQGHYLASVAAYSQQMTMFQPVGGMDRIPYALAEAIGADKFTYQAEVQEIRQDENGVRVVYRDLASGEMREATGDYCLCNLPLSILTKIPADFEPAMAEAVRNIPYEPAGKMGLQFSRRFWEEEDRIFGGVTRTNVPTIGSIAYPSYGFLGQKGVIQGYYNFAHHAIQVSNMSLQARIDHALEFGSKIHPQYRDAFETGFSVAWHRVPYSLGGWPTYTESTRQQYYPRLLEPDGRIYLVGEHLSYLTGWIEGAIRAAWLQIEKLHRRVQQ
jgi:monoamine oxidase